MDSKNVRHVREALRRADCELEERSAALGVAQVDFDLAEQAVERAYRSWLDMKAVERAYRSQLTMMEDVALGGHNE